MEKKMLKLCLGTEIFIVRKLTHKKNAAFFYVWMSGSNPELQL